MRCGSRKPREAGRDSRLVARLPEDRQPFLKAAPRLLAVSRFPGDQAEARQCRRHVQPVVQHAVPHERVLKQGAGLVEFAELEHNRPEAV